MLNLLEISNEEWREWLAERDIPKFRAGQVMRWIFEGRAVKFDQMTDLPLDLRRQLDDECRILTSTVKTRSQADDGTEKLLLELSDGELVECVLLRNARGHRSICISTQVGCAMGCKFCASGLDGLVRNLTAGEIIEQMLHLQRLLPDDERLSHI
ncbi:MAG: 23S rRNA (adenine(2503)-C(2))-methyltransferase RlmN, partial [Pirellulales bacterium]|nr:23S rRNA (adenine(2503)-C(2))-methyltransferase RlmN [Pirellulales bacterium]